MSDTVLVVDPDVSARTAMLELLTAAGYTASAADAFESAIAVLKSARPGLLITAVRLGLFNGLDLVVRGRASEPKVAALVVDDVKDTLVERESRKAGALAYLVKPVDSAELLERVAAALTGPRIHGA
jgi:DNA-binding response OmpR family regulator